VHEEKKESARQRTLARELEWVRSSPRARQAKSKARLANYQRLVEEAGSEAMRGAEIRIPAAPRLSEQVIVATELSKGYGERLLIDDLSFSLPQGGIVGVIGANGAGKTTLFRMIAGLEEPDGGALRVGETVQIAYVDQSRDALNAEKTVWSEASGDLDLIQLGGREEINSRAYLAQFNFRGTDQQKLVGQLSGGERNRLHLAKLLAGGGNLLLLDEPTNDLDVDTLRALEDALASFSGCVMVTSHDRWFIDRLATHILAFEGDSQVRWFEGNYQEYEAFRKRELGPEAAQPHRITYRRLTH
jgi:ATPase subunit of ABC transporter with duplicated ATPase domains